MPDISNRTFRIVRKGFDPDEVRRYLHEVQMLVNAAADGPPAAAADLGSDMDATQIVAAARAEAEAILADAHRRAADAHREEEALTTWLGGADGPGGAHGATSDAEAVQRADEIIAAAQAQAESMIREAEAQAAGVDRWDGLGEHVARIVQQAELEATAIVAEARGRADALVADAEAGAQAKEAAAAADRAEAARALDAARVEAGQRIAEAEAEAASLRAEAEPRARDHIEAVLAGSHQDLETKRADLQTVLDQLEQVQGLVAQALANRAPLPEFYAAERFLNGAAVASDDDLGGDVIAFPSNEADGATADVALDDDLAPAADAGIEPPAPVFADDGYWTPPPPAAPPAPETSPLANPWGGPAPTADEAIGAPTASAGASPWPTEPATTWPANPRPEEPTGGGRPSAW